jgi:hypothetical protein
MGLFSRDKGRQPVARLQTTKIPILPPETIAFLRQLTNQFRQVDPTARFEGQLPGESELQGDIFSSISDQLGDIGGRAGSANEFLQSLVSGNLDTESVRQGALDDFNQFQLPLAQRNQEESRRALLESLAGTGGFDSGATTRAFARGETDFNLGLQSQLGQILQDAVTQRITSGLSAADLISGQQSDLNRLGLAAGESQRNIGVDQMLFERENFLQPQQNLLAALAPILGTKTFDTLTSIAPRSRGGNTSSNIGSLLNLGGNVLKSFF